MDAFLPDHIPLEITQHMQALPIRRLHLNSQGRQFVGGTTYFFPPDPYSWIYYNMKTTIDLPEEVLAKAKIVVATRRTTLRERELQEYDKRTS